MSPEKLTFYENAGMGADALKYLNFGAGTQMLTTQPAAPTDEISMDDPLVIEHLIAQGSPEAAEKRWSELTGWSEAQSAIDNQMSALLQANPDLPMNRALYIAEAEKARLRSQAPGVQALEIAKQRLTEKQEAAKGVQSKFTGDQWALLQELLASGVPSIEATRQVVKKIPFGSINGGKDDEADAGGLPKGTSTGGSSSGGGEAEAPTQTDQLIGWLGGAEDRVKTFAFMRNNPEVTDQAVRDVLPILNTADVTPDENDPESTLKAETLAGKKTKARSVVDAITEMQQRGLDSPVMVSDANNFDDVARSALQSGKPILVQLPDGKWEYKKFSSPEEIVNYDRNVIFKKSEEATSEKAAPATAYRADDGFFESVKRGVGWKSTEETDKDLAYWKTQAFNQSLSVADRADALLQIKELEKYRNASVESDQMRGYIKLTKERDRLAELVKNPGLSKDEKAPILAELERVETQLKDQEKKPGVAKWGQKSLEGITPGYILP